MMCRTPPRGFATSPLRLGIKCKPEAGVLGSDTVIELAHEVLGKPADQ